MFTLCVHLYVEILPSLCVSGKQDVDIIDKWWNRVKPPNTPL